MKTASVTVGQCKITGYTTDYVFNTIKNTRDFYESAILNKWSPYFEEAKIILDIGANLGNHTLYWANNKKYNAIYAFEPYTPNYNLLEKNISDNKLDNIVLVNKAVGRKKNKVALLNFDESNYGGTTFVLDTAEAEETVELVAIDEFIVENEIKNIDFVKIDTEGFELDILYGFMLGIENFKPDFWIEVSANSFSDVINFLEPFGYVLVDIEGFNLLFLHPHRHENIIKYGYNAVLSNMFHYLEKTNLYYKNYETAKKWVANKDQHIVSLKSNILKSQEEINTLKNEIEIVNNTLEKLKAEYCNQLLLASKDYELIVTMLEEVNHKVQQLEMRNEYLKSETAEYRRKLSIITDSWWGKIGIKAYKKMKRVKAKLCK